MSVTTPTTVMDAKAGIRDKELSFSYLPDHGHSTLSALSALFVELSVRTSQIDTIIHNITDTELVGF